MAATGGAGGEGFVKGRNVLVTGCTHGIGEQICHQLAAAGAAKVFLGCRNGDLGQQLAAALEAKGAQAQVVLGDLATVAGAVSKARQVLATEEPVHVLVSNAGTWEALRNARVTTADELEVHFAVNYLSTPVLVKALLPLLKKSKTRVLVCGSFTAVDMAQGVVRNWDLQSASDPAWVHRGAPIPGVYNAAAYAQSKLLLYMWAKRAAEELRGTGVTLNIFEPGGCQTNNDIYHFMAAKFGRAFPLMKALMGTRTAADGARPATWLADAPEAAGLHGMHVQWKRFYGLDPRQAPVPIGVFPWWTDSPPWRRWPLSLVFGAANHWAPSVADPAEVDRLWEATEELCAQLMP